jgi:hypothetical protein
MECEWCGDAGFGRLWEIPEGAGEDHAWVCKTCHTYYFDDDLNHVKRMQDRVV